jgi:hypothetical protein
VRADVGPQRDPEQGTASASDRGAETDDSNAGRQGIDDERRRVEGGAGGCHQLPVGTIGQDASDGPHGERGAGLDRHDQADRRRRRPDVRCGPQRQQEIHDLGRTRREGRRIPKPTKCRAHVSPA